LREFKIRGNSEAGKVPSLFWLEMLIVGVESLKLLEGVGDVLYIQEVPSDVTITHAEVRLDVTKVEGLSIG
jgi:hypothetical protein